MGPTKEGPTNQEKTNFFSPKPIAELQKTLSEFFVGREREIDAVLAGLISGEPVILVGPPGTAKTMLIETMAKMINAKYFYYLLTKFTEPDEVIGPLDIVQLREGKYVRKMENRLPTAEIVFLDEIFKASSAIRNTLLDIILNKRILNGVEYVKLPLLALYTASNEISTDEEDRAFYDRLLIRSFVRYLGPAEWELLLIKGVQIREPKAILDVEYVKKAQEFCRVRAMEIVENELLRRLYLKILAELKEAGIELSDRRKVKTVSVAAALSLIYAEQQPSRESIIDALRLTAPHDEDDVEKVERVLAKYEEFGEEFKQLVVLIDELKNKMPKNLEDISLSNLAALKKLYNEAYNRAKKLLGNRRYRTKLVQMGIVDTLNEIGQKLIDASKMFE